MPACCLCRSVSARSTSCGVDMPVRSALNRFDGRCQIFSPLQENKGLFSPYPAYSTAKSNPEHCLTSSLLRAFDVTWLLETQTGGSRRRLCFVLQRRNILSSSTVSWCVYCWRLVKGKVKANGTSGVLWESFTLEGLLRKIPFFWSWENPYWCEFFRG